MKTRSFPFVAAVALMQLTQISGFAQLYVDFNSSQNSGGTPVAGDPADGANAAHNEPGYLCYHARHEVAGDFVTATYAVNFTYSGAAMVSMTPAWPNTTAATVRQSIGRSQGQADSWTGNNKSLLRDWIGVDSRTAEGGKGTWSGTAGTPTYLTLTFTGLPGGMYEMTSFFHDVENMNSFFTIEVSADNGATFGTPISGRMTNSTSGGTPAENEVLAGTAPNVAAGDPKDLTSTQVFTIQSNGTDPVVLRFAPLSTTAAHRAFFGVCGFRMEQLPNPDDDDGDGLPNEWEALYGLNADDNGLNPNNNGVAGNPDDGAGGDPDGDLLTNIQEYLSVPSTDPTESDTDDDGLDDNEEKTAGSNPTVQDTDGDTLLDGEEVKTYSTSPILQDTDGDFFLDQTEAPLGGQLDANVFPVSMDGMFVDFTSTNVNGQSGPVHDQSRLPYVADHEVDGSVDKSVSFVIPAFANANVTLSAVFPDAPLATVKQMIGRVPSAYTGSDADLARDWIGVDARAASGGGGTAAPTRIQLSLTGLPTGAYLFRSFHHDAGDQAGTFEVLVSDANRTAVLTDARRMTSRNAVAITDLTSTFEGAVTSNGVDPVVIEYQAYETLDGNGATITTQSFLGINGFDLTTTDDQDGDGLPDAYEDANGLDKTVSNAGGDQDMDGLTNLQEYNLGTAPNMEDTDVDGANDGAEVAAGSDPFVQDTDGDGLLDGPELALGAGVRNRDSDGDGILDGSDPDPLDPGSPATGGALVSYWPLNEITNGTTSPDEGPNGYDLTVTGNGMVNIVTEAGRTFARFDSAAETLLSYTASENDQLPINKHLSFTVAMWVKIKGTGQNDRRFFSESSTAGDDPLFNMGTRNTTDEFDMFLRDGNGATVVHQYSAGTPLDGTWHHLVLTSNGATERMQLFVDGVLDKDTWNYRDVMTNLNVTSIGGILRVVASHWVTGDIDEVGTWNKVLSFEEVAELASGTTPGSLDSAGPKITSIVRDSNTGNVSLTWLSKPGASYTIRISPDLVGPVSGWGDLSDNYASQGDTTTFVDDGSPKPAQRFYVIEEN